MRNGPERQMPRENEMWPYRARSPYWRSPQEPSATRVGTREFEKNQPRTGWSWVLVEQYGPGFKLAPPTGKYCLGCLSAHCGDRQFHLWKSPFQLRRARPELLPNRPIRAAATLSCRGARTTSARKREFVLRKISFSAIGPMIMRGITRRRGTPRRGA